MKSKREIERTLKENKGPGFARQTGIDNTKCLYFTCIDADDTFAGPYSLQILLKRMEDYFGQKNDFLQKRNWNRSFSRSYPEPIGLSMNPRLL